MSDYPSVESLVSNIPALGKFNLLEEFIEPAKPERTRPVPAGYQDSVFRRVFTAFGLPPNTVWLHQGEALDAIDNGMNALLSTATASGKTLIFQLASLKKIIEDKDARILVYYPTRALNNDQMLSWQKTLEAAGLPSEYLALIDGSVAAEQRLEILSKARICIMTPDVQHAWMMSNLKEPVIKEFIKNIQLTVLDEAHLYDGSFGTHFSYLLRRLRFVQNVFNHEYTPEKNGQIIAASATIANAEDFMKSLTGFEFWPIGAEWDGSPRYEKKVTLVGVPDFKQKDAAQRFMMQLGTMETPGTTICFVDSRMAVDDMANQINRKFGGKEVFLPYRSGYTAEDRTSIENEIRQGTCKGVISTSALEVGIDIKGVRQVILAGMPEDVSSFRQRVGRVRAAGNIVVFEQQSTIDQLKLSLKEKLHEEPRQPILYRGNTKLIAEAAVCFLDELAQMGIDKPTMSLIKSAKVTWPVGFNKTLQRYLESDELSEEMRKAIPPSHKSPQRYHSLRSFDGPSRRVLMFDPAKEKTTSLGEYSQTQALSEAYPGAVIHIRGRAYRITKWTEGGKGLDRNIWARRLSGEDYKSRIKTRPYVKTSVTTYLNDLRVQGKLFRSNEDGDFMADAKITVAKNLTGFSEMKDGIYRRVFYGAEKGLSREFSEQNSDVFEYSAEKKSHVYDTTGVVIRIGARWFGKDASRKLGFMLMRAVCEEFNISQKDLGVMTKNLRIGINSDGYVEDKALVLFDKTPGSLYLSRNLFLHFDAVIMRMMNQCADEKSEELLLKLHEWYEGTRVKRVPTYRQWTEAHLPAKMPDGYAKVYAPSSVLNWARIEGERPVKVRVENIDVIEGTLMYGIKPVSYEFNPYHVKGERKLGVTPTVKAADYLAKHYVSESHLREPGAATFRMGIFNLASKKMVTSLPDAKLLNDNVAPPKNATGVETEIIIFRAMDFG